MRDILVAEAGGCCAVCGYDRCIINLHFHHVDPKQKSFPMNMGRGKSLAAYRAEAEKCVLVCANCHGEIEGGLIASPPPKARYGEDWEPVDAAGLHGSGGRTHAAASAHADPLFTLD